jgi:hypothetical protein
MHAISLSPQANVANDVLVHLLMRMASVKAEDQPFPHFFVENIFPQHVYDRMLASQPVPEAMVPMGEKHENGDGTYNRHELALMPETMQSIAPEHRDFWTGVHRALTSPQFKMCVFGKLRAGLAYRYGCRPEDVNKIAGFPRTAIMRETRGYSIAPHPDGRRKVVTMQFAMPADESQKDLGTTFYERSLSPRDWMQKPRGFRRAKQMPFLPNCAYGFAVLNNVGLKSWHGREMIEGEQGTRSSLLHVYYGTDDHSKAGY